MKPQSSLRESSFGETHSNFVSISGKGHPSSRLGGFNREAFTLVEIMIVLVVISMLAAISIPSYMRARKRTQASRVLEDLRLLDNAIEHYAIETSKGGGYHPSFADLKNYIKVGTMLYSGSGSDILGNAFGPYTVDDIPKVNPSTMLMLSEVTDASFWSPYQ
jgi:prepilin-type N-terminal cleavage/methylation domain-containing protein